MSEEPLWFQTNALMAKRPDVPLSEIQSILASAKVIDQETMEEMLGMFCPRRI